MLFVMLCLLRTDLLWVRICDKVRCTKLVVTISVYKQRKVPKTGCFRNFYDASVNNGLGLN